MNGLKQLAVCVWALAILATMAGCEIGVEAPAASAGDSEDSAPAAKTEPAHSRAHRGKLNFVEGYQQGHSEAARQAKPMMLFFTAEWCNFCNQMAEEAFTHPQVVRLSEGFVCILVDADLEPQVCREFKVTGYPTIQFLSPHGAPLERIVGKKPGHQLMMAMQAALQKVARRQSDTRSRQNPLRLR
jgi:thiol:disulfide interchange protein